LAGGFGTGDQRFHAADHAPVVAAHASDLASPARGVEAEAAQRGRFSFGDVTALSRSNLPSCPVDRLDALPESGRSRDSLPRGSLDRQWIDGD